MSKKSNSFILNAFALSIEEMQMIKNKYPAFATRVLTEKAKGQGAFENEYGCGYSASRSADPGFSYGVGYIGHAATEDWHPACNNHAVSWVGTHHIYNPESRFVRSVKLTKRTATVWMPTDKNADKFEYNSNTGSMQEVTSEGHVGVFGGKEYLIVNYEKARKAYEKDGTMLPMLCAEVGSHKKAVPYSEENDNNYSKATKFHKQYERILFEDATEEEKQYIVPTEFICEMKEGIPCYDKSKPRVDLMKKEALEVANNDDLVTPELLLKTLKRLQKLDDEILKKENERKKLLKIITTSFEKGVKPSDEITK